MLSRAIDCIVGRPFSLNVTNLGSLLSFPYGSPPQLLLSNYWVQSKHWTAPASHHQSEECFQKRETLSGKQRDHIMLTCLWTMSALRVYRALQDPMMFTDSSTPSGIILNGGNVAGNRTSSWPQALDGRCLYLLYSVQTWCLSIWSFSFSFILPLNFGFSVHRHFLTELPLSADSAIVFPKWIWSTHLFYFNRGIFIMF